MLRRVLAVGAAVLVTTACGSSSPKVSARTAAPLVTTTTTIAATTSAPTTTFAPTTTAVAVTTPVTTARPPVTATPATTTSAPPSVHVTAADNGKTVTVADGATVIVDLASGELWSEPASSDSAVLTRTSGSVDASTGDATATFSATAKGSAKITATHRCLPRPGMACAMYVALWSVNVTVT